MSPIQHLIDEYADESDYAAKAEKFLNLDRWTGDDPLLLLADAAGTTTGQNYFNHVMPAVERFHEEFLESGRIDSLESLSRLDHDDEDLVEIFEAKRKRRVLIDGAGVIADVSGSDDLDRLQQWARDADPYNYTTDPFGSINGVGLRTFQYLRMNAGIDTVKPDIQVRRFVEAIADVIESPHLDASSDQAVLESCEWISAETGYRLIELDQIAWWRFADANERHAAEEFEE
ncbi:hypothetical protein [Halorussus sp. AFM4]|uniref:hypothetical protein n=1 Tax=Halorussus sp. AFM4 TaxID=3421651 RepID=UPI003EB76240